MADFHRALPPQTERQQHGVRGLAEIAWRHARVWGGRGHAERVQFYYWLGQAASRPEVFADPLDPFERLRWVDKRVSEVFQYGAREQSALEAQSETLRHQAGRIGRACVEELTGQPDPDFRHGYKAQRRIATLLDRPGEMMANPFKSRRAVARAFAIVVAAVNGTLDAAGAAIRAAVRPTEEWLGWSGKRTNGEDNSSGPSGPRRLREKRNEEKVVQFGLARLMAVEGLSLPDPLKPEDFARHLNICRLALGMASGIEDCRWTIDDSKGADGPQVAQHQSPISNHQSPVNHPSPPP